MAELNQRDRTIRIKIVYYGPPVGGKTTNLKVLHSAAPQARRAELISVNSAQDRTILFDFMPLRTAGFRGYDVRLRLLAVPGQPVYSASRRVALKATDGVVFVANSAIDRFEENTQSYSEMCRYLADQQLDPARLPLVLQYNKRDLPEVLPIESLEQALNHRRVPAFPAVAMRGEGVLESFGAVLAATIADLSARFRSLEIAKGLSPEEWVAETLRGIFGTTSLGPAAEPATTGERRTVRIALSEDFPRPPLQIAQHAKLQEALAESYAEASAELSLVAGELRQERDLALRRLRELRAMQEAGEELAGRATEGEAGLRRALGCLAEAGGSAHASLLLPGTHGLPQATSHGLEADPLAASRPGLDLLGRLGGEARPLLLGCADTPELARALEAVAQPFAALVAVPLSAPSGIPGLALLYYATDAALPAPEALDHLELLGRMLRSALRLAARRRAQPDR